MTQFLLTIFKWTSRCLLKTLFRLNVVGLDHLNQPGPALLLPNHVSWLDWLFIGAYLEDDWTALKS